MAGQLQTVAEVIAALMWGPKTADQLMEQTVMSRRAVYRWLEALHRSGVVYIADEPEQKKTGPNMRLWALQTAPFAIADFQPRKVQRPTARAKTPLVDAAPVLGMARAAVARTPASSSSRTSLEMAWGQGRVSAEDHS